MRTIGKKLSGLLLCCMAVLVPARGHAVDFKVKGAFEIGFETSNVIPLGVHGNDTFQALQRLRTQIDAVASENVSGSLLITVGTNGQYWGSAKDGAALGADGNNVVGIRAAYIDWLVPKTEAKVRMGIQPMLLPGFVTDWSAVYGQFSAGVTVNTPVYKNDDFSVGATAFWGRPYNDNSQNTQAGRLDKNYLDNLDIFALVLPVKAEGLKVSPWGMYALIGENSLRGINDYAGQREPAIYAPRGGLMPILGSGMNYFQTFEKNYRNANNTWGNGWWGGITVNLSQWEPWDIAFDATYGYVDMGELQNYNLFDPKGAGKTFQLRREGWYAAMRVDYKLDWGTPGILAWYGSGDDDNPYNGSERLPVFNSPWPVTPLGFGGGFFDLDTWKVLGHNPGGMAGIVGSLKDVSLIDDLKHTLKFAYFWGTNSADMPKNANMTSYPTRADGPMAYLTTTDHAWEASLSNTYKIYENFHVNLEGSYVKLYLDPDTWHGVEDSQYEDNWRVSVTFRYTF
ncbi:MULTISPECIES: outer membrane homotrimeric porin [Desulfovibrio]|uniref:Outer membrane insertion protein n=3 Tax=Desulfovibrio TaxID=872 RepID=A0AA94L3L5_DESDE|nr:MULTISPECIES: outer membrane homotrimeric porin [Desulfovibrio]ATD81536.1 outer membrane insertion protein [Desulfovibrio sp. G11]MDY0202748.1 outer membrane homotrimeric porin [Desulfovibrio desulfuricans]SFW75446.1 hypothetical protein SAMN02910291_02923 [Desulfovibrio desulfuricans]SPD34246.1 Hypothetical protein DSVG11_0119 [Desulfovibrio sp. G11]